MSEEKYLVDIQHEQLSFFTSAGEVKALNDVSIRMKEGEVLGIVGESGSGKSTAANMILQLPDPTAGNETTEIRRPECTMMRLGKTS